MSTTKTEIKARLESLAISLFTIKGLKTRLADDGLATYCTLYLDGKMVGKLEDHGDGVTEGLFTFKSHDAKEAFEKVVSDNGLKELVYESEYSSFMKLEEMTTDIIVDSITSILVNEKLYLDEIKKLSKNKIVFGSKKGYRYYPFKNIKNLKDILKYGNGLEVLQRTYNKAKAELAEGETILNPEEQLTSLGIKL